MPAQNPHFVGRQKLLKEILFLKNNPICVLTGGLGFGKSQIAKQCAYLNKHLYDVIWWFSADQPLTNQFGQFATALNTLLSPAERIPVKRLSAEALFISVRGILRKKPLSCLLIFDNVTDFKQLTPYLPTYWRPGLNILMTSRIKITPHKMITITPFLREESIAFIQKLLPSLNQEEVLKMVTYFKDHPLALATAASFLLEHPSVSAETYRASHNLQEVGTTTFSDSHGQNLFATLKMTTEALKKEHPEAFQVLQFLTFLHHGSVSLCSIKAYLKEQKIETNADKLMGTLYAGSLVDVNKNQGQGARFFMHELIHEHLHRQNSESEKRMFLKAAIQVLLIPFEG